MPTEALTRLDPVTGPVHHAFDPLPSSFALSYGDDGAIWTAGTFGGGNRITGRAKPGCEDRGAGSVDLWAGYRSGDERYLAYGRELDGARHAARRR